MEQGWRTSIGPGGEVRPAPVIANAVLSMQIATGEVREAYAPKRRKRKARRKRRGPFRQENQNTFDRSAAVSKWCR